MSDEIALLSLVEAAASIKARTITPLELVDAVLRRIDQFEPQINAYISFDAAQARAAAKIATDEIARGQYRGPLHGITYGLKDVIHVAGRVTSANSRVRMNSVATEDAEIYRRLSAAGAILIGKLNTYEYGTGTGADLAQLPFPPARNPWNTMCFTGGSSTGAGAAVAARLAMFAIGIDTGGSVRLPAAACGVAGMKPTYDLVSRAGIMPNCPSLDHVGPLARSVKDVAAVLSAIADPPVLGSYSIAGIRIGVVRRWHARDVVADPSVDSAFEAALRVLASLGACLVDLEPTVDQRQFVDCMRLINNHKSFAAHRKDVLTHRDQMGPALFAKFMSGLSVSAEAHQQARRWRKALAAKVDDLFTTCDIVVCPTTPRPAPPISDGDAVADYTSAAATMPFSLSGHPALSIPMGFSADGLPLGLQISGRRGQDGLVLRVGDAFQDVTEWHRRRAPCTASSVGPCTKSPSVPVAPISSARARVLLAHAGISSPSERDLEICATQAARMDKLIAHMQDVSP